MTSARRYVEGVLAERDESGEPAHTWSSAESEAGARRGGQRIRRPAAVAQREAELSALQQTRHVALHGAVTQAYGTAAARTAGAGERGGRCAVGAEGRPAPRGTYDEWVERSTASTMTCAAVSWPAWCPELAEQPLVSIVMPVYDPPETYLRGPSIGPRASSTRMWSSASPTTPRRGGVRRAPGRVRPRRRPDPGRPARTRTATSRRPRTRPGAGDGGLGRLPGPRRRARREAVALAVSRSPTIPSAGLVYSDEDKIDDGVRSRPRSSSRTSTPCSSWRRTTSAISPCCAGPGRAAGRLPAGSRAAQDWDLALRVTELLRPTGRPRPHVLYHWRAHAASTAASQGAKPYAGAAARRAVD